MSMYKHNEINVRSFYLYNKMSWLNRIRSTASRAASNVLSGARRLALSVKPNFYHCNIFSEDLVAVHMKKTKLVFNKLVYLGMCI